MAQVSSVTLVTTRNQLVDIRDRIIPGQVDFAGRKRLDERVIVGIQDSVERNALLLEMRLQASKHGDMLW